MPKENSAEQPVIRQVIHSHPRLAPDEFYYNEQGSLVFTAQYHLRRGYCCKNQCRHCPYNEKKTLIVVNNRV